MLRLQLLFLSVLFLATALAGPIRQKQKRSFKIPRLRQANYVPNGKVAYRKALFKFGFDDITFQPNTAVASKLQASTNTSIAATGDDEDGVTVANPSQGDSEFLSPVTVGGQTLVMDFDTGSSDMWVFNTNLAAADQKGHTIYDPTKSNASSALTGSTFNISYGDGSFASGPVGLDTVDIGGATVDAQAIGLPTDVSSSFVTNTFSNGLVGLAFSKLNTIKPTPQKTFFDNVMADLTQPLFTADLKSDSAGSYEFGQVDTSLFTGSLQTAAVDSSNGFWQVDSTSAVVSGQTVNLAGGSAIIDTGTSLMLVSDELVVAYWDTVQGAQVNAEAGGVIFPCNADLPDVQVAIGDHLATVSGANMNFASVGSDSQTGQQFCFGGLQSNQGLEFSIYGDVFLRSQFVVFDGSGPSISVAPHS
ncbi:aspergillopepsin I [Exophiala viscosa]|uniref:aspergillopepsin I n=1 Tax=Exophiala viscosa TaxID=2486360 RepID=UPI002191ECCA|nr:aspergillopepsin I [Exophiala viscosa]